MKNTKKIILITTGVDPKVKEKIAYIPTEERINQVEKTLSMVTNCLHEGEAIVHIVDGTGFDLSKNFENIKKGDIKIIFTHIKPIEIADTKAKAEMYLFNKWLEKFEGTLGDDTRIIKITGRYLINDLRYYLDKAEKDFFFKSSIINFRKIRLVHTALFCTSAVNLKKIIHGNGDISKNNQALEEIFGGFIGKNFNINSIYIDLPKYIGVSGISGLLMENARRYKLHRIIGKIIPMGIQLNRYTKK